MSTRNLRPNATIAVLLLLATLTPACAPGSGEPSGPGNPTVTATPASPAPGSPQAGGPTRRATPPALSPAPSGPLAPQPSAAPSFPSALRGQDPERIPTDRKVVALTFDAGASADAVPSILATLASQQIRGTFYLTGDFVRRFPQAAKSIATAGHRLGNHSASHPHFTTLTGAAIQDQVTGAERDIRTTTGADPRPLFRFPFGDRDARTIGVVNDLGYLPVRWTVDTLGWQGTSGGRSASEVTRRVLDTAQPGQIVLMHVGSHPTDGSTLDADALPAMIAGLRQRGYQFVTLDALLTG